MSRARPPGQPRTGPDWDRWWAEDEQEAEAGQSEDWAFPVLGDGAGDPRVQARGPQECMCLAVGGGMIRVEVGFLPSCTPSPAPFYIWRVFALLPLGPGDRSPAHPRCLGALVSRRGSPRRPGRFAFEILLPQPPTMSGLKGFLWESHWVLTDPEAPFLGVTKSPVPLPHSGDSP